MNWKRGRQRTRERKQNGRPLKGQFTRHVGLIVPSNNCHKIVNQIIFIINFGANRQNAKANATGRLMTPPPQSTSKILQNPVQRRDCDGKVPNRDQNATCRLLIDDPTHVVESNSVESCHASRNLTTSILAVHHHQLDLSSLFYYRLSSFSFTSSPFTKRIRTMLPTDKILKFLKRPEMNVKQGTC